MEETHSARRSSGIYDVNYGGSNQNFGSTAYLPINAQEPAGYFRTTQGGVAPAAVPSHAVSGWDDQNVPPALSEPPSEPKQPFYKKRWFIISQIILIPLAIALLFIILFPVVRAIVALVIKRTNLDVQAAFITQPTNSSFDLQLEGFVFNTGIFNAKIQFTEDTQVSWIESEGNEHLLGHMRLHDLTAKSKRAVINDTTSFVIDDEVQFGRFSSSLITSQNFTWRLVSHNLRVQALKFPVAKGLTFEKVLTLNGFNSFSGNVVLKDLQLPSDNPAGGIDFVAVTEIINPSAFALDLGTVMFALSYLGVPLGNGTSTDTTINPGSNVITLKGVLIPHTDPNELAAVSQLFTNYLNGENSPVIARGDATVSAADGSPISWLTEGLKDLTLNVPFKAPTAIDPIRSITLGNLALQFDTQDPWEPQTESNAVQAALQLPFGFGLSIGQIQNEFMIVNQDGSPVAGLSTPLGASRSAISVLSPTNTVGTINITIADTRLTCPDPQHAAFSAFNQELTTSNVTEFMLVGQSRAVANMSIGQITLDPIKVNVTTSLNGLQGLKGRTVINTVDVLGGTTDGLTLGIDVSIFNPSNLILSTGDLTLQLSRDGAILGTTLLPNLTLAMGNNTVKASSNFQANNSPQGTQTLNDFVSKKDVNLVIAGFDGSTQVASLAQAFSSLSLDVVLPGLKTDLLNSAALKILETTGKENNISQVTVSLANPFSAPLRITQVTSTVSAFGIPLGNIDQGITFESAPKSTTESPPLNLNMNFDPSALFTVTRALALEAGLDVAPLEAIVQLGGFQFLPTTQPVTAPASKKRQANIFAGFDLTTFVQTAFKQLKSDVQLTTGLTIGDYSTNLQFSQLGVPTATDQSLDLILPILAAPIVQKIVGGSNLGLDSVMIVDPAQNSFTTRLKGGISNAGPFDATISFPSGLTISWEGKPIGKVALSDVKVVGDVGGTIDAESTFEVLDVAHLTDFTKTLLTSESFVWDISGENLTVNALGISVPGIAFATRSITLKGFNGLKNGVVIQSFDLPSNDPAGGIHLTLQTTAANPSQVGIQLDSLSFNTFVGDVMIASVASAGTTTLSPESTSPLALAGRLVPQNSAAGLATVSGVFNNFVQGQDSNVLVVGAGAGSGEVTWLNEGIKVLQIAAVLPNQGKQNVIKSIALNELTLMFSAGAPFSPSTSSKSTDAAFTLPFAFPLDITSLEQTITIGFQGTDFAQLAIPKGPSSTDVASRIIHITFDNVPFAALNGAQTTFNNFIAATTVGGTQTLHLSGAANAEANTAVGVLSLTNIDFSVDSDIDGLQGLNTRPVTVSNLDVNHGFPDFLLIKVDSSLFNPSNLTIGTGDVSFSLDFQGQTIGSADISDLVIVPGNGTYPIDVHFAPQGGAVGAGQALLEGFIQGVNSDTTIAGSMDSTDVQSLKLGLSQIRLSPVTIPGLQATLIKSASLTFPTNIVQTGIASTSFVLANPFTASINLLKLGATASFHGITLGVIPDVDTSAQPIRAEGHGQVTSPGLPLNFNLDPTAIIQLLLLTSQTNGVSLGPLADLFQFILSNPDFKPLVTTTVSTQAPTCVSGNQFDADGAILKSLAGLKVDLDVNSSVKLDDFATDLSFKQLGVPAITDQTSLFLIGAVAGPVAQHLVDGSVLAFTEAVITNITNDGFDLALKGSLTNVGPLDALISFTEPVTVTWEGKNIATINLADICAAANTGVPDYEASARLTITDQSSFTEFATFLLHNPSFDWTISTDKLRVTALGTIFDGVTLSKVVTFKAFNNLPGVTIANFQLPSDDPAGGIHIETDATIPSPSQLGIDLGSVTFQAFFQDVALGPLAADNLSLSPNAVSETHLSGRITPKSGSDLDVIGTLFSGFLAGQNLTLVTKGDTVQPPSSNGAVTWLSDAFKTLELQVILPGEKLAVIQEIDLADLAVTMLTADQAFAPPTSSQNTIAKYKNPFGFSLQVVESAQTLILGSQGTQIAELDLPRAPANGGVSTGNVVDLAIAFQDIPLKSLNPTGFAMLFAGVTLTADVEIDLSGSADVVARTTIGDVPISGIPIDVTSDLKGIASFGGKATLSDVSVDGSGPGGAFISTSLKTTLENPSQVSLDTVSISLPVIFNGVTIGRSVIDTFDLKPGTNVIDTEFRYQPANANDTVAQSFLTQFIQTAGPLPLTIQGDTASSPFPSLQGALSNLQLASALGGLNQPVFITQINVIIPLSALVDNLVEVEFFVQNPLSADLVLEFVQSDAGLNGEIFAAFSQPFSNFVVPPGQTVSSGVFGNVLLTQGVDAALGIIPALQLDVAAASTVRVGGPGGYQVPWLKLAQMGIPTTYTLDLFDAAAEPPPAALSSSTDSSTATATSASASASETATASASATDDVKATPTPTDDTKATPAASSPTPAAAAPVPASAASPTEQTPDAAAAKQSDGSSSDDSTTPSDTSSP